MKNLIKLLYYDEEVKPVIGFNGYYVSNLGRVFSAKKQVNYKTLSGKEYSCIIWKELKPFYTHRYKTVTLTDKGKKRKNIYVHTLVYEAFNGEYDKQYLKVVYKNGDTENCTLDNLKLDFRKRTRANLMEYVKRKRILDNLTEYKEGTGTTLKYDSD